MKKSPILTKELAKSIDRLGEYWRSLPMPYGLDVSLLLDHLEAHRAREAALLDKVAELEGAEVSRLRERETKLLNRIADLEVRIRVLEASKELHP